MAETRNRIRILHVDDEPDLADLAATFLERENDRFRVETATSGEEGFQRLAADEFDCVVSDYNMPQMDGIEFLDAVREEHPDIPFILFTGKGNEEIASEAIAHDVTDYLQKGSGSEQYRLLANRIENAVQQYRAIQRATALNRIHRLHRDVNQALVRAETRGEIIRRVCDVISDADPYLFAWIGEHDPDEQTVAPQASAGIEEGYLERIDISIDDSATGLGPTGRAVKTRELAVMQDIPENPEYKPWRQDALERGYRSSAAIPLVYDDTLYGVLNVYADRTNAFDERERELLSELGDNIAHAIYRTAIRTRQKRYEHIIENLPVGVYRAASGPNGELIEANPALADIFDAESVEAMLEHDAKDFYESPEERAALSQQLEENGVVRDKEFRQVTLDGDDIWISVTAIRTEENGEEYFDGIIQDVTEHRERERQLRRFQSAVEHAGHVVLITDTDGTIEYVNNAFESVTGYAPSEAIGQTPAMLQSGEHSQEFYRDLWATILDGDVWEGELVNERKYGDRYIINQTIAPITDSDDEITGFVAINQDITDRKERELNLASLKRAIDQAGIGIGTYDADGYATYVNQRLSELFGIDREGLRDTHVADLDPELDHDRFQEYWNSFEDGERRIYETSVERVDTGRAFPAEVVTSRVSIDGDPYLVNTVRDVTERKRRERDLRQFRSAVEHAGHGVLITDTDGTIEYVNDAFEGMSGYSAAEAIGQTPAMLQSGEHDQEFYRELWATILDGDVWEGEVVNERKDGKQYVIDQTIAPITDSDGELSGFVAVNRDITDLKEYERELEAQNERLKQYGHTVAHDLRNPLTLLYGELDRLRTTAETADGKIDPELVRDRCEDIDQVTDRMETLIDELLAMAEQGQLVLDAQEISLETVAGEAWEEQATGSATLSVEDAAVDADPDRLRELLSNLFRNAIEHAGADVRIRVGPLDLAAGFFVEDDGPGIPPDQRDRVLERGFTTEDDGTGFGLAIVEQIARAHGWSVSITDGEDGGARFVFQPDGS